MELKLLEDFLVLAEWRNFSRAAEIRHVSQSTFSKRIQALEQWAGTPLIDRSSYPVSLTPAGLMMVPQARELSRMTTGLRENLRDVAERPANSITFAAMHTLLLTFMPRWRKAIEQRVGKTLFNPTMQNDAYLKTLKLLRNGDVDMLLTYSHPTVAMNLDPDSFDMLTLAQDRVLAVCAPDKDGQPLHPLDSGNAVHFLGYGNSSFFGSVLSRLLAERPLALSTMTTNAMAIALRSLALVGCGATWLPESLIQQDLATGRLCRAAGEDWDIDVDVVLFRNRHRHRKIVDDVWQTAAALMGESQKFLGKDVQI